MLRGRCESPTCCGAESNDDGQKRYRSTAQHKRVEEGDSGAGRQARQDVRIVGAGAGWWNHGGVVVSDMPYHMISCSSRHERGRAFNPLRFIISDLMFQSGSVKIRSDPLFLRATTSGYSLTDLIHTDATHCDLTPEAVIVIYVLVQHPLIHTGSQRTATTAVVALVAIILLRRLPHRGNTDRNIFLTAYLEPAFLRPVAVFHYCLTPSLPPSTEQMTTRAAALRAAVSSLDSLAMFGSLHPSLNIVAYGCGDGTADVRMLVDLLLPIFLSAWLVPSNVTVSGICTRRCTASANRRIARACCERRVAADGHCCVSAVRRSS